MRTIGASLLASIQTRSTTLALAMRVTREDGQIYGFTTHDVDASISGVTYSANPGLDATSIVSAAGLSVGNLELITLHDDTVFTTADIFSGTWRNAAFLIFRYDFNSLGDGTIPILAGTFGEVKIRQNTLVIELRDLRQYFKQGIGPVSSKTCRARLGDSQCTVVLGGSPSIYTVQGTITHVTSQSVLRDSARTEAADWFGEGSLQLTSGPNSGRRIKILEYATNGTFTLAQAFFSTVSVGNTYQAIAGCRKRREEDCITKFNNVLNFDGEPDRRGINNVTQAPTVDV